MMFVSKQNSRQHPPFQTILSFSLCLSVALALVFLGPNVSGTVDGCVSIAPLTLALQKYCL